MARLRYQRPPVHLSDAERLLIIYMLCGVVRVDIVGPDNRDIFCGERAIDWRALSDKVLGLALAKGKP